MEITGHREAVLACRLGGRRLTFGDAHHYRCLALGRAALRLVGTSFMTAFSSVPIRGDSICGSTDRGSR